jgi:wyosine [tRNA(Phe)-imidazoG37] synthetase (radical SAM superfamily)
MILGKLKSPGWVIEPFIEKEDGGFYNPVTDQHLSAHEKGCDALAGLWEGRVAAEDLPAAISEGLRQGGWIVRSHGNLFQRYRLMYVSFEASSWCNQACYFCPVSIEPRGREIMAMDFYAGIVSQLTSFRNTLRAVFMSNYNEPTAEKAFLDRFRLLRQHGLPVALNTNATGLTPDRVSEMIRLGGLVYLSVNLSTLDPDRYARQRSRPDLPIVLKHLNQIKDQALAERMEISVLGDGSPVHHEDYEAIKAYFKDTNFDVRFFYTMDRAGNIDMGLKATSDERPLAGCRIIGSRPLQHLHITPKGTCVLCCQDYHHHYVVGDLRQQKVEEVLSGPLLTRFRRWSYGLEASPDDFICKKCIFALRR